ncbi:formate--tetrahydrofolate ligase [Candidatus Woesearchaeota archaeon]|nr:formate--tetrahydrofolate ligase [Candidatus Woesearchaeota archaeon]
MSELDSELKTDIDIAQSVTLKPIREIAEAISLPEKYMKYYGENIAKISLDALRDLPDRDAKLVLVTAMTPTPAGEGKTTTSIGLTQALQKMGKNSIICIREPSLGPCFGIKGGAAGGGWSQVLPMEDINLHFTGDIHAMGAAHNLLSAMVDNHLQQRKEPLLDPKQTTWGRVVDMNDRALRNVVIGLGGAMQGVPRESGFDITVASEIMAIVCLATSISDLKKRLSRIIVGYTYEGEPVTAKDIKAQGAMTALLRDTIMPNLVQTIEGGPAFVHGGPFANIAHGCSSLLATKMGLKLGDIVITEAGFGSDLGAEKFMNIKCRMGGLEPDAVVIVATMRALRFHGGQKNYSEPDVAAVRKGVLNLQKHIENMRNYGVPAIVALNRFTNDDPAEVEIVHAACKESGAEIADSFIWAKGGEGGLELAEAVLKKAQEPGNFKHLYEVDDTIQDKIKAIATKIYGADGVNFTPQAEKSIAKLVEMGVDKVPVCIAKTPLSLSDDPTRQGRPEGFTITVRDVQISNGAGFAVALAGDIMKMPGLPKFPAAEKIDVDENGKISGLF